MKRHFKYTGESLHIHTYKFAKVHGTRFIGHQFKGLTNLLHNWIVLAQALEDSIAGSKAPNAKLLGILQKLKNFTFLRKCCIYLDILHLVSSVSLIFERDNLQCYDILPLIDRTKDKLQEILSAEYDEEAWSEFAFDDDTVCTLSRKLPKTNHLRRKAENREFLTVSYSGMTNVSGSDQILLNLKSKIIPNVQSALDTRFRSFESAEFSYMKWLDPANWCNDSKSEIECLNRIGKIFAIPLSLTRFDSSKINTEWKDFKSLVKHFYPGIKTLELWERILNYRKNQFPNISLLAELVLTIGVSNSVVEAGFSSLTAMLTDRRLNMTHSVMENLLLLKINNKVWKEKDRNELIESALTEYTKSRRKIKMDESNLGSLCESRKRKRCSSDDDSSTVENLMKKVVHLGLTVTQVIQIMILN